GKIIFPFLEPRVGNHSPSSPETFDGIRHCSPPKFPNLVFPIFTSISLRQATSRKLTLLSTSSKALTPISTMKTSKDLGVCEAWGCVVYVEGDCDEEALKIGV
ncbi:hypothetical protein Droror1_Dr00027107, partial [Drosera rotundifolia]